MASTDHYVIIGNGPAGNAAAETLREKDPDCRITIISDENIPFYYKPKLTNFISGQIAEADLLVYNPDFYTDQNIRLRLGQRVEEIEARTNTLYLSHMEAVNYTKLLIATGSKARVLPSMESYAHCLSFITEYEEVVAYRKQIRKAESFFIFGGDLVGFRFLKMLRKMGKQVTLMICPHAFWPFNITEEMQDTIAARLSDTGARIITQDDISHVVEDNGRYTVTTQEGQGVTVDMVFSFNGLVPRVDFARGCGLDIDRGILVNEYMQTCLDDIYACGSCAQIYNPKLNTYTTSIGWPNAQTQGRVAAENILGENREVQAVGRKYFDLEGVKIKTTWWEDYDAQDDNINLG